MDYYNKPEKEPIVKNLALVRCSVPNCHHCEVEERQYYRQLLQEIYESEILLSDAMHFKLKEIFGSGRAFPTG